MIVGLSRVKPCPKAILKPNHRAAKSRVAQLLHFLSASSSEDDSSNSASREPSASPSSRNGVKKYTNCQSRVKRLAMARTNGSSATRERRMQEQRPARQKANCEGPKHVEVFFDRERPKRAQGLKVWTRVGEHVAKRKEVGKSLSPGKTKTEQRRCYQQEKKRRENSGKALDPKTTPKELVRASAAQDGRDQVPTQNEEKINSHPPRVEIVVMVEQHEQDSDPPKPVKT